MRRLILAAALLVTLGLIGPANAVVFGEPDGNRHPEVGALLAHQAYSDGTWEACSGTLIAPRVFLTAAHCDLGFRRVAVTFDPVYRAGTGTTYWGTWHENPGYNQRQSDPGDIAVVLLDSAPAITPARLPTAGSLSGLPHGTKFTSVGYGAQSVTRGPGGLTFHYADIRYRGVGSLNSVTASWLRISSNPATGDAGTCYGDSGGPNFLGAGANETRIVAGTTITGDAICRATNVDYRLDTRTARSFLRNYVTLP